MPGEEGAAKEELAPPPPPPRCSGHATTLSMRRQACNPTHLPWHCSAGCQFEAQASLLFHASAVPVILASSSACCVQACSVRKHSGERLSSAKHWPDAAWRSATSWPWPGPCPHVSTESLCGFARHGHRHQWRQQFPCRCCFPALPATLVCAQPQPHAKGCGLWRWPATHLHLCAKRAGAAAARLGWTPGRLASPARAAAQQVAIGQFTARLRACKPERRAALWAGAA